MGKELNYPDYVVKPLSFWQQERKDVGTLREEVRALKEGYSNKFEDVECGTARTYLCKSKISVLKSSSVTTGGWSNCDKLQRSRKHHPSDLGRIIEKSISYN